FYAFLDASLALKASLALNLLRNLLIQMVSAEAEAESLPNRAILTSRYPTLAEEQAAQPLPHGPLRCRVVSHPSAPSSRSVLQGAWRVRCRRACGPWPVGLRGSESRRPPLCLGLLLRLEGGEYGEPLV